LGPDRVMVTLSELLADGVHPARAAIVPSAAMDATAARRIRFRRNVFVVTSMLPLFLV
jgi:hypothetical protein